MSNKDVFKLLKALKRTQEALGVLDEAGVDVDRLIGISNAQGPQAKVIKNLLAHIGESEDILGVHESSPKTVKRLGSKQPKRSRTLAAKG